MKKIISFEKKIEFSSMIGEITSISLDHTMKFVDKSNISGDFIVSGTFKMTEASRILENFEYKIPAEIILTEELDVNTASIEIDDFYYEIEGDYNLICHIDVLVEGVEEVLLDDEINNKDIDCREKEFIDDNSVSNEVIDKGCDLCETNEEVEVETNNALLEEEEMEITEMPKVSSLFENINESEETYSTYSVYILRENETINSLIEKYKTTKEELENYNDLSNLSIGSKVIIPLHEE